MSRTFSIFFLFIYLMASDKRGRAPPKKNSEAHPHLDRSLKIPPSRKITALKPLRTSLLSPFISLPIFIAFWLLGGCGTLMLKDKT